MSAYTNHKRTTSVKGNEVKIQHRTLRTIVSKNLGTTAAQVTAELNTMFVLKPMFSQKLTNVNHGRDAVVKPLITEMHNQWCHYHRTWILGMMWADEPSFTLFMFGKHPSLQSTMPGSNSETWGRFFHSLGSSIMVVFC
jgi:hypothetical protein